jgi:hypothetical protein
MASKMAWRLFLASLALASVAQADAPSMGYIQEIQLSEAWTDAGHENGGYGDFRVTRLRSGVEGRLHRDVDFKALVALAGIESPGSRDEVALQPMDLYARWWLTDTLHATVGLSQPQLGREHLSNAFAILSHRKAFTSLALREHVMARATGRAMGINLGHHINTAHGTARWDVGVFEPSAPEIAGTQPSGDQVFGAARLAWATGAHAGDGPWLSEVSFDRGTGLTLGVFGSYQGESRAFDRNALAGADLLFTWRGLRLSGEYQWLDRRNGRAPGIGLQFPDMISTGPDTVNTGDTTLHAWSAKLGWQLTPTAVGILEPTVSASGYSGEPSYYTVGDTTRLDVGLNWYFVPGRIQAQAHFMRSYIDDVEPYEVNAAALDLKFTL